MITIIHGDDIVTSRKKLTELTSTHNDRESFRFDGEGTSVTDIVQAFESRSLFGKQKLLILEKFIEAKNKAVVAAILNHLKKDLPHDVVFWEPKQIKKELLALFPKGPQVAVFYYKVERLTFRFLDAIVPGNIPLLLSLLADLRKTESEELIFYMLVRQFRLLLGVTTEAPISEVKRLAPWQKAKLSRQARQFTVDQLTILYKKLFRIEKEAKTGQNALPLPASLDLFLTSI